MAKSDRIVQLTSHIFLILLSIASIVPFVILIASSFTAEEALVRHGYNFIPAEFSMDAYRYLIQSSSEIVRAYGITIFVTVVGTTISLAITSMLAYGLSRKEVPFRNTLTFLVFFTLLFNGGLVPTYMVYTQIFDIKNTIWALIVPSLLMNGFNVLLMRAFFMTSVPEAI